MPLWEWSKLLVVSFLPATTLVGRQVFLPASEIVVASSMPAVVHVYDGPILGSLRARDEEEHQGHTKVRKSFIVSHSPRSNAHRI